MQYYSTNVYTSILLKADSISNPLEVTLCNLGGRGLL